MGGDEEGSLVKDGSIENLPREGEGPSQSPGKQKKGKKGSISKTKSKKVKKDDPNIQELLKYKKSEKTKKLVLDEKVPNPEKIMEYI